MGRTAILLGLLVWAGVSIGETIHIPADYLTIQDGIDAAVAGDTVLVADGTYTGDGNKNLKFMGKAITVMSGNGPEWTIIDCENDGKAMKELTQYWRDSLLSMVIHLVVGLMAPAVGSLASPTAPPQSIIA